MFKIKICGITNRADLEAAEQASADAIGINFYPRSLRCVESDDAAEICRDCPSSLAKVGVFVNESVDNIRPIVERCGLDFVQLHGDERPEILKQLSFCPCIKAFRLQESNWEESLRRALKWIEMGAVAILVDSPQRPNEFGGSGQAANWSVCRQFVASFPAPVILAGGLNPENVQLAIQEVGPAAVDAATGVEGFPGKKNPQLMIQFVHAARLALGGLKAH